MGKGYPIPTCYAMLAQAVLSRAIIDGRPDVKGTSIYKELYGPLIYIHNEMFPHNPVTDPFYAFKNNVNDYVTLEYIRAHVDSYFLCVCSILSDIGVKFNITDIYITSQKNKWIKKGGTTDKPVDILSYYTQKTWEKEVISSDDCPVPVPESSFVVCKRGIHSGHNWYVSYSRVISNVLDNKYKCTYLVFRQKED